MFPHRDTAEPCLTGQAVVALQLRGLHGPLLLLRQGAGLAEGGQQRGKGLDLRVSKHPAQPLDLQQSAVVLPDRLPVLLILVALGSLALEVQSPPHHVPRFIEGGLFEHGGSMVPLELLLLLLLDPRIFAPARRLSALPRGSTVRESGLNHTHIVLLGISLYDISPVARLFTSPLRVNRARCCCCCSGSSSPSRRLVDKHKASGPMGVLQQEEEDSMKTSSNYDRMHTDDVLFVRLLFTSVMASVDFRDNLLGISWVDSGWVPILNPGNVLDYFSERSNPSTTAPVTTRW
ncbi:hypothetical protein F7725_008457 [Dissostichus mawsoni]|uniref:Uncharacterized protein n=1 Tax=Dissostichus mawsoni TaxID=36200 RepID=A0A7J5Y787_DISMA|nr:hypothetical protein F7725_008457 [Dissostichus mawsoni]